MREEKGPQIKLGEINFKIREIESTPSPLKLLEFHIEILNNSQQSIAPPNSIRVAVAPKEIKFASKKSGEDLGLTSEETTLNVSIPPRTGRVFIMGFTMPKEGIESITLEVQINPPEGDKKIVSFNL